MSLPRVTLAFANGSLLADTGELDGMAGLVGTGASAALLNKPVAVYNLDDALSKGFTEAAEPSMYRHLKEYYQEVAGNKKLIVMIVPGTVSMTQMLDNTNTTTGAKILTSRFPEVRLLGVFRTPPAGYAGGEEFIDSDVRTAVLAAKTFGEARLGENSPLRILIEGRVQNATAVNNFSPKESATGYAGVVLGGTLNTGSASVGLVLGRACKYEAHVKIGKVINGPLSAAALYVGTTEVSKSFEQGTYNDAGFITFMTYAQKAGYYLAADRMCSTDDYRLLAYGRIIDKAAVIAATYFIEEIENEAEVDDKGNMASHAAFHLEERIKQQLSVSMGHQMSGEAQCQITGRNIVSTGRINVKLRILPKGYTTYIDIELGFVKTG